MRWSGNILMDVQNQNFKFSILLCLLPFSTKSKPFFPAIFSRHSHRVSDKATVRNPNTRTKLHICTSSEYVYFMEKVCHGVLIMQSKEAV